MIVKQTEVEPIWNLGQIFLPVTNNPDLQPWALMKLFQVYCTMKATEHD